MSSGIQNLIFHVTSSSDDFLTSTRWWSYAVCARRMKGTCNVDDFGLLWAHQHHYRSSITCPDTLTLLLETVFLTPFGWVGLFFVSRCHFQYHITAHIHKHDGWKVRHSSAMFYYSQKKRRNSFTSFSHTLSAGALTLLEHHFSSSLIRNFQSICSL